MSYFLYVHTYQNHGFHNLHIYNNSEIEVFMTSSVRGSFPQRFNENIALRQIIFSEFFVNSWGDPHMNNFPIFGLQNYIHLVTISGRNDDTFNHTKHCSDFQQSPFENFQERRCRRSRRSQLIEIRTVEKSSKHCCCLSLYRTQDDC